MSIIIFIIILAVLIISHEFGHFIVAKKSGIRVDEFGVGFPPRIWGVKKGETTYSINWIPLGGFVKVFGEDPEEESISGPDSARSLVNKSKWTQVAVLVAGVAFNIILAWFLISVGYMYGLPSSVEGVPSGANVKGAKVLITSVLPKSPAELAGIKPKDNVVSIADKQSKIENPSVPEIQDFLANHPGKEVMIGYKRLANPFAADIATISVATVTPQLGIVSNKAAIGISLDKIGIIRLPIHLAVIEGAKFTYNLTIGTVLAFGHLIGSIFQGNESVLGSVVGPIGLIGLVGDASTLGLAYLLSFAAFISINLAVINMIPFPALDGGRVLFVIIEAIKGSPINPKVANYVNTVGFGLLLLLMLAVTYSDIARLLIK